MKVKLNKHNNYWRYHRAYEYHCTQKQFDYVFKYLDFDKLDKNENITFNDNKIKEWFYKTHINTDYLKDIYNDSQEGYQWLKENWGKGIFRLFIWYTDKQELKTIVNKVVNIELIRGKSES